MSDVGIVTPKPQKCSDFQVNAFANLGNEVLQVKTQTVLFVGDYGPIQLRRL
jgi:hypothetical protein